MNNKIDLYFNEEAHSYKDNRGFTYTSMTTVIGKYEEKFDTDGMARRVTRSRKSQYYGWTVKAVKAHWEQLNKTSLDKGNRIHNWLESAVKQSSGYNLIDGFYINDKIYTVNTHDFKNSSLGELSLEYFQKLKVDEKYPRIYKVILAYVNQGYKVFSEIGIFDTTRLISGLIDILLMNPVTKDFVILDWKTNKHELVPYGKEAYKWLSGYFKKDNKGNDTHKFIKTNTYFKAPLNEYQQSHYMIYALQLSGYASLVEALGYTCSAIVLCHIREEHLYEAGDVEVERLPQVEGLVRTDLHAIPYIKEQIDSLFNDHNKTNNNQASI